MFSLSEKFTRLINKLPKPIVMAIGFGIMMYSDYTRIYVNQIFGKGGTIAYFIVYFIGITILFSPDKYKLLKTSQEIIEERDERNQMIKAKASEKASTIMMAVFCVLILLCLPNHKEVAILLGILLIVENTIKYILERRYDKVM